jgi:hypothetical protein
MIIQNNFPNNIERKRVQTIRKYEKIHDNDQESVLLLHDLIKKQFKNPKDIIYLSHAIPSRISEFYSDFVQGDADKIAINLIGDASEEEEKLFNEIIEDNNIIGNIEEYAYDQSEYGFEVLLGYIDEYNKYRIQVVPKDQYFPQKDGSVIFATYIYDPEDRDKPTNDKNKLLYTQHYYLENKNVKIERKLWTIDDQGVAKENVALGRAGITDKEEETLEDLGRLPIQQIDNGRRTDWGFGKSDYNDIMPQLQEVNERRTHISTQLLKNLDAKMQLPAIDNLKSDDGKLKNFEYLMVEKEDAEAKYILNDNPLIDATEKHVENQLKFISWVTAIPMFELLKSAMPERVDSMRIQLFGAIRKTMKKRAKISTAVKEMIKIGFIMKTNKEMDTKIEIKYGEVLPSEEITEVEVETAKIDSGLSSRRSAMKRLNNFTDEEVERELEIINKEGINSGAVNPNNPPRL